MQLFYSDNIDDTKALLSGQESQHCAKVLRKKVGDVVHLLDGKGTMYEGEISIISRNEVHIDILKKLKISEGPMELPSVGVGLIKNAGRLEWLLEKATEIGVSQITPLICQRSERVKINPERLDKIIVSAMKQSMRLFKPLLMQPVRIEEYIMEQKAEHKLIAHYDAHNVQLSQLNINGRQANILIGPEGDFTEKEIQLATAHGYREVNMGVSRLRTETAVIVALTLLNNKLV